MEKRRRWIAQSRQILQILPIYRSLKRQEDAAEKTRQKLSDLQAKNAESARKIAALQPELETVNSEDFAPIPQNPPGTAVPLFQRQNDLGAVSQDPGGLRQSPRRTAEAICPDRGF
jgi:hypothetical protein